MEGQGRFHGHGHSVPHALGELAGDGHIEGLVGSDVLRRDGGLHQGLPGGQAFGVGGKDCHNQVVNLLQAAFVAVVKLGYPQIQGAEGCGLVGGEGLPAPFVAGGTEAEAVGRGFKGVVDGHGGSLVVHLHPGGAQAAFVYPVDGVYAAGLAEILGFVPGAAEPVVALAFAGGVAAVAGDLAGFEHHGILLAGFQLIGQLQAGDHVLGDGLSGYGGVHLVAGEGGAYRQRFAGGHTVCHGVKLCVEVNEGFRYRILLQEHHFHSLHGAVLGGGEGLPAVLVAGQGEAVAPVRQLVKGIVDDIGVVSCGGRILGGGIGAHGCHGGQTAGCQTQRQQDCQKACKCVFHSHVLSCVLFRSAAKQIETMVFLHDKTVYHSGIRKAKRKYTAKTMDALCFFKESITFLELFVNNHCDTNCIFVQCI